MCDEEKGLGKLIYGHALIVEDNRINQIVLKKNLLNLGYTSDVAEDGFEALKLLNQQVYDLIFMDLQMPKMGGVECTVKIRQHPDPELSRVPIIAVTANTSCEDRSNCHEAGMDDFLEKPLMRVNLIRVLRKLSPDNHFLGDD
jgi:CheY-like chemotaxis protein